MRAGVLIGTVAVTCGVIASGAQASAEPCPPEVCNVPGLPGWVSDSPMMPRSMSDLPDISQFPGWVPRPGEHWNPPNGANFFNAPTPDQAPSDDGPPPPGRPWAHAVNGEPNPGAYPPPASPPGG